MIFAFCAMGYHPENRHKHNGVFDRFIRDISGGDEEIEDLLLCVMAAMLLPSASFKKAFMLLGRTHSGKSLIMWLLRQIIGGENIAAVNVQQFAHKHQLSEFVGKVANIRPDASTDTISSDQMGIFKSLVSGGLDVINAPKKFSGDLTLRTDTFRMMFGFNRYPLVGDKDDLDAYLTRWVIVPFQYSKPEDEQDKNLQDKLMQEIDYIIFCILKKAKWLRENNFLFPECKASQQALSAYRLACSKSKFPSLHESVDEFVMELCMLEKTDKEHISILYEAYDRYCDEKGETPMTSNSFKNHLCERYGLTLTGKFRKGGRNTYGLNGIQLKGSTD